jgi:flagellar protein FliS
MFNQGIQSYRKINVTTSNPLQLILMCYEGAINNLRSAKEKYLADDFEGKGKAIKKFMEIIAELQCALDFENGGEVARNLDAVYSFMTRTILQADMEKDLETIDIVINMLNDLLSSWKALSARKEDPAPAGTGMAYSQSSMTREQGYISV